MVLGVRGAEGAEVDQFSLDSWDTGRSGAEEASPLPSLLALRALGVRCLPPPLRPGLHHSLASQTQELRLGSCHNWPLPEQSTFGHHTTCRAAPQGQPVHHTLIGLPPYPPEVVGSKVACASVVLGDLYGFPDLVLPITLGSGRSRYSHSAAGNRGTERLGDLPWVTHPGGEEALSL